MSKKHARKPAPVYPPSWFEIRDLDPDGIHPFVKAIAETMRRRMSR